MAWGSGLSKNPKKDWPNASADASLKANQGNANLDVDALVLGFLDELNVISSEIREDQKPEMVDEHPLSSSPVVAAVSAVDDKGEAVEPEKLTDEIDNELKRYPDKVETIRPRVVPIADRRDESAAPSQTTALENPDLAATTKRAAGISSARSAPSIKEQDLDFDRIELFRRDLGSRKAFFKGPLKRIVVSCFMVGIFAVGGLYVIFNLKPWKNESSASKTSNAVAVPSMVLTKVTPVYPELGRRQKVSGRVEIEAEISEKGDVVRAKAISGPILLRAAAETAVLKWKFRPASVNGANVTSKTTITLDFVLR